MASIIPTPGCANEGKGRVFYTAYGHEDRTWSNIGFLDLVSNGVHWALGDQVNDQIAALNIPSVDIYDADTIAAFTKRHLVPKMQEALTASESQKLTQVLPDFKVELFASDPDIINPIAMAWDERGRLWVVESVDYPNTFKETDGQANDRIKICEDTDGDGKADKFTVFADGLNIPTSMIILANDGIHRDDGPRYSFHERYQRRRQSRCHGGTQPRLGKGRYALRAFQLDLWVSITKFGGSVGYSGFNGTDEWQERRVSRWVYYHFKPSMDPTCAYLGKTSNNTWGLGVTEDNNIFLSTANNTHSAFYSMPENYLMRAVPGDKEASELGAEDRRPLRRPHHDAQYPAGGRGGRLHRRRRTPFLHGA